MTEGIRGHKKNTTMEKPTKSIDSLKEQEVEGENVKGGKSLPKFTDANAATIAKKDQNEFEKSLPHVPDGDVASRVKTPDAGIM